MKTRFFAALGLALALAGAFQVEAAYTEADILETIEALGYEYIGGNEYEVTYQAIYYGSDQIGMQPAPPVGVASYAIVDLDGDGADELLLQLLVETERIYDSSGLSDAKVCFVVYEETQDGWKESQSVSMVEYVMEGEIAIMTLADFIVDIQTYLVPVEHGYHIVVTSKFRLCSPADQFPVSTEIVYTEDEMSGVMYGFGGDGYEEAERYALYLSTQESASEYMSRIYLTEYAEDGSLDSGTLSILYDYDNPGSVSTTLVLRDNRLVLSTSDTATEDADTATSTEATASSTEDTATSTEDTEYVVILGMENTTTSTEEEDARYTAFEAVIEEYQEAVNDTAENFEAIHGEYSYEALTACYPYVPAAIMEDHLWGRYEGNFYYTYYDVNHDGTEELLTACGWEEMKSFCGVYALDGEDAVSLLDNSSLAYRTYLYIYESGAMEYQGGTVSAWWYLYYTIAEDGISVQTGDYYMDESGGSENHEYTRNVYGDYPYELLETYASEEAFVAALEEVRGGCEVTDFDWILIE